MHLDCLLPAGLWIRNRRNGSSEAVPAPKIDCMVATPELHFFAPQSTFLEYKEPAASSEGSGDVVVTPVDTALQDHLRSPLGGQLRSPPEPVPKKAREDSEEKAKYARSEWENWRAANPFLRLKAPPFPPKGMAPAPHIVAMAVQEAEALTDEQVREQLAHLRTVKM